MPLSRDCSFGPTAPRRNHKTFVGKQSLSSRVLRQKLTSLHSCLRHALALWEPTLMHCKNWIQGGLQRSWPMIRSYWDSYSSIQVVTGCLTSNSPPSLSFTPLL